jgi:V8-like Glu-specific endopeptidase
MPKVQDPQEPPFCSVALLRIELNNARTGWGTGAVIDAQHILTCAHNLISRHGQYEATRIDAFPGYSSDRPPAPVEGVSATNGFYPRVFAERADRSWDIAVLRLKDAIRLPMYMSPVAVEQEPKKELQIAGYPSDHHYRMWTDVELWSGINIEEHIFAYLHETAAGSSGSPVYEYETRVGVARQYGVHSGFAQNHEEDKVGVLITRVTKSFVDYAVRAQPGPEAPFLIGVLRAEFGEP